MMYNSPYFNNTMPTSTQPYGYAMNNVPMQTMPTQQPTQNQFTNIIFVSGLEDVKKRYQAPSSEMYYADNDKPLLYKKIVYANGQFDVKIFDISEHCTENDTKDTQSIDLSCYVKTSDLDPIERKIKALEEQLTKYKQGDKPNGTNTSTITRPTT